MQPPSPLNADWLLQCMRADPGRDWAILAIGSTSSRVQRQQPAGQPPSEHPLSWGNNSLAAKCLRHFPPTEADVETAIMEVEDAVMPLVRQWPAPRAQSSLLCLGADVKTIAAQLAIGADSQPNTALRIYPTTAVEDLFNRFADTVMGSPARGLQLSNDQAATLILIRECLHHWGMQTLALPGD